MSRQLLPVGSRCSLEAEVHSLRTTVGKCCPLASYINFIPGYHQSPSPFCAQLLPALFGFHPHLPLLGPSLISIGSHDFCATIPKLRHHMRCRKGGSRPNPSPSPSSYSSPSRNPSECAPCCIHGCGQARHLPPSPWNVTLASHHYIDPRPAFIASPPSSAPPIIPHASSYVPPVPVPVDNNPSRLADDNNSGPLERTGTTAGKREAVDDSPQRIPDLDPDGSSSGQLQNTRTTAGERVAVDDASQTGPNPYPYDKEGGWCRIEEESPSDDYGL